MMNDMAFGYMFGYAILSVLSRASFRWLRDISYTVSGKTLIDAEIRKDKIRRKEIPRSAEIDWLVSVSPKPVITKVFYFLYYACISVAPSFFVLSVADIFIVQLDYYLGKVILVMIGVLIVSLPVGTLISNAVERKWNHINKRLK